MAALRLLRLLAAAALAGGGAAAEAGEEPRTFTKAELRAHGGKGDAASAPLYLAIQGIVFDVSSGSNFYAEGAAYNALVGQDSTRAVALMSLEPPDLEAQDDVVGLSESEMEDLALIFDETYVRKYPVVGVVGGSRALPRGKSAAEWWAEVPARQREKGEL